MGLKNHIIKSEYRSLIDNVVRDFYIPLLGEAVVYRRAVGFFSSTVLAEISSGIYGLVRNGGHIQLIASPFLSEEDIQAIRQGYTDRETIIKTAIRRELREPRNSFQENRLNFLANLIADEILDIKIAVTDNNGLFGMYHEKMGIIEDAEGNKVAFAGSMNESANALLANYETIDVYTSWSNDIERVKSKEGAFSAIWNNYEPNVRTYVFQDISDEFVEKYKKKQVDYSKLVDENELLRSSEAMNSFFTIPESVQLFEYQKDAIAEWIKNSCCGIFDMATGSGKTYTALGAISTLSKALNDKIAVIIVAPYQHLVEQWVDDIDYFGVYPIVAYSYPGQKWRKQFLDAVNGYNTGAIDHFCIITTNATFSGEDFQKILSKFRKNFCFIVDEAHYFGAVKLRTLLPKKARYRLALSATIDRHRDKEGTSVLRKFFGKTCIEFTLKDAIQKGFLTSYYYHPVIVNLNQSEREKYNELTAQIIKNGGASEENIERNPYVELLLIKRARIVAGCHSKVSKLIEVMRPYKDTGFNLVYCGATRYDHSRISDEDDVRQIDEVCYRIHDELSMKVRKFTASENKEERKEIREMFSTGSDIQVIAAIKCLDEGVNIPAIRTAFIMASSTNPKEYIQRRGRVLRRSPGKNYAEIYDFITLPRPLGDVKYCSIEEILSDLSLVKKEFARMLDFAETARNPFEIDDLKDRILEAYHENDLVGGNFDD